MKDASLRLAEGQPLGCLASHKGTCIKNVDLSRFKLHSITMHWPEQEYVGHDAGLWEQSMKVT